MMPEAFTGGSEGDLRFQFEIIKQLAQSIQSLTETVRGVQQTQITMLERLARIESNRVNEDVARLQLIMESQDKRIDILEQDKDRRDGGSRMRRAVITWWPAIGVLMTVLYLLARASGLIHLPQDNPTVIMAPPAQQGAPDRASKHG